MDHDGWHGTLVINPTDQGFSAVEGNCTYHGYRIDGKWSSGPNSYAVRGTLGGKDVQRRAGEACPASEHKVVFTVAFPGLPPQPFEGYIYTHERRRMAGLTWWQGVPFGWSAAKA